MFLQPKSRPGSPATRTPDRQSSQRQRTRLTAPTISSSAKSKSLTDQAATESGRERPTASRRNRSKPKSDEPIVTKGIGGTGGRLQSLDETKSNDPIDKGIGGHLHSLDETKSNDPTDTPSGFQLPSPISNISNDLANDNDDTPRPSTVDKTHKPGVPVGSGPARRLFEDDPMTDKLQDLLQQAILNPDRHVNPMQVWYPLTEDDYKVLVDGFMNYPSMAWMSERTVKHEDETKALWTQLYHTTIESLEERQYDIAVARLEARNLFDRSAKEANAMRKVLHKLTKSSIYVGPGVNMRTWTRSEIDPPFNVSDCQDFRERIDAENDPPRPAGIVRDEVSLLDGRRIAAEYHPPEPPGFVKDEDLVSLETEGTRSIGEEDQGGNKTTNHVESDMSLFCQADAQRGVHRKLRIVTAIEAKKQAGCAGHPDNNSHTQDSTCTRICHAADGCAFGMVVHGVCFRIYQITPGVENDLTTWIPPWAKAAFQRQNGTSFEFKYKDSYEVVKTNHYYMWSLSGRFNLDKDALMKQRLSAEHLVSFIMDLHERVYRALETQRGEPFESKCLQQPNDYLLPQNGIGAVPVRFTDVSIEAVTPRLPKTPEEKAGPAPGEDHGEGGTCKSGEGSGGGADPGRKNRRGRKKNEPQGKPNNQQKNTDKQRRTSKQAGQQKDVDYKTRPAILAWIAAGSPTTSPLDDSQQ